MKRLASCDSLGGLISICPNSSDMDEGGAGEYQAILGGGEEVGSSEKKRRLSGEQVKALEKNFEVDNKLEPDRKMKLAAELGLQPRQVAVWFQNRRARWKTKQLERDYAVLKSNHDSLKNKFEVLQRDNESLINQIEELKSKLNEEGTATINVKREQLISEDKFVLMPSSPVMNLLDKCDEYFEDTMKDGPSDSDSSAILNEDNNGNNIIKLLDICKAADHVHIRVSEENGSSQMVKTEEHDFFAEEESCTTFFADDQPPCLNWYCSDSWN